MQSTIMFLVWICILHYKINDALLWFFWFCLGHKWLETWNHFHFHEIFKRKSLVLCVVGSLRLLNAFSSSFLGLKHWVIGIQVLTDLLANWNACHQKDSWWKRNECLLESRESLQGERIWNVRCNLYSSQGAADCLQRILKKFKQGVREKQATDGQFILE